MSLPMKLELYRLFRKPLVPALIVAAALLLKGFVFLAARLGAFGGVDNGFAFIGVSARYTIFLATFLLCIGAASSLSGEYASGLLRMHLARPVSRVAYFLNRAFYMIFLALVLVVIDAGMGTLVGGLGFGFHDVADVRLQGPQFSSQAMMWLTIRAYALTFAGMAGVAMMGLLISTIFRTPTLSLGMATGLFLFLEGMRLLFREPFAHFVVTRYASLHMDHVAAMARGIAEYTAPDLVMKSVGVPLAYLLVAGAAALILFTRKDILD